MAWELKPLYSVSTRRATGKFLMKDKVAFGFFSKTGLPALAQQTDLLRILNSHDRLIEALDDLTALAEAAMERANRDDSEFNIDAELKAARAALALARGEVEA